MKLHCPECNTELKAEDISFERSEASCPSCRHAFDLLALLPPPAPAPRLQPPEGSKALVQRPRPEEVTLYIPSRGGWSMVFFGGFWNLFMTVFTVGMWAAGAPGESPWFVIPLLLLFWCIGLGLLVTALFSVRGKTLVHVEPGRLAVKKELFGKGWTRIRPLGPEASADLVVAYKQNETPVYACAVGSGAKQVKFASFLSDQEKHWLVELLNDVLEANKPDARAEELWLCPSCGEHIGSEDRSLTLGLARCRRCNDLWTQDELAAPRAPARPRAM